MLKSQRTSKNHHGMVSASNFIRFTFGCHALAFSAYAVMPALSAGNAARAQTVADVAKLATVPFFILMSALYMEKMLPSVVKLTHSRPVQNTKPSISAGFLATFVFAQSLSLLVVVAQTMIRSLSGQSSVTMRQFEYGLAFVASLALVGVSANVLKQSITQQMPQHRAGTERSLFYAKHYGAEALATMLFMGLKITKPTDAMDIASGMAAGLVVATLGWWAASYFQRQGAHPSAHGYDRVRSVDYDALEAGRRSLDVMSM